MTSGSVTRATGGIDSPIVLRFGGGLHSKGSIDEIDPRECADGKNFDIELGDSSFQRRPPLDLMATAPNGEEVRGFGQLVTADDTRSTLVQAGGQVYSWDGAMTFTEVGNVPASSRLRGKLSHNFTLTDTLLVTDLDLNTNVKTWDGTTFQDLQHNLGSSFRAKYCLVDNERAWFGNVTTTTATPHLIAASKRGDPTVLTVTDRPSSGLSDEDPFIILAPDLRPVNGLISAFNSVFLTTRRGQVFRTFGDNATDFAITRFEASTGAAGEEAFEFVGNDIVLGNAGRIDTVIGVESFGDARVDDFSRQLGDIEAVNEWQIVYNERVQKIYCFAKNASRLFVARKSFLDAVARRAAFRADFEELSPWSRYETNLDFALNTAAAMVIQDPLSGELITVVGGQNGEIYRMEGTGALDGGTQQLTAERTSGLISLPASQHYNISGWVKHKQRFATTLTLSLLFQGEALFDRDVVVSLQADQGPVYGGGAYYGGSDYYGIPFSGRLRRKEVSNFQGEGTDFQVRASITGEKDFAIQEIGLEFHISS